MWSFFLLLLKIYISLRGNIGKSLPYFFLMCYHKATQRVLYCFISTVCLSSIILNCGNHNFFLNLFCLVNVYAPNFWGYSHEKMPFGGGQFIDMVIYLLSVAWVIEDGKFQT